MLASDAAHFYDTVTEGNPFTIIVNLPEMCAGWERIFELGAEPGRVIPGHDPLVSELYAKHPDDEMSLVLSRWAARRNAMGGVEEGGVRELTIRRQNRHSREGGNP